MVLKNVNGRLDPDRPLPLTLHPDLWPLPLLPEEEGRQVFQILLNGFENNLEDEQINDRIREAAQLLLIQRGIRLLQEKELQQPREEREPQEMIRILRGAMARAPLEREETESLIRRVNGLLARDAF